MSTLNGNATATTLAGLSNEARIKAKEFFGLDCVHIEMGEATLGEDGQATATFKAGIWHNIERRSYGPGICRGCGGKDWPHRRLNSMGVSA